LLTVEVIAHEPDDLRRACPDCVVGRMKVEIDIDVARSLMAICRKMRESLEIAEKDTNVDLIRQWETHLLVAICYAVANVEN
jgi:hypothetical protein